MFATSKRDSLTCPLTCDLFRDPVSGQDGHTYERSFITSWLQKNGTSPFTREPMSIDSLRPNHIVKKLVDEFRSSSSQKHYSFKLDVDIRKAKRRPIFQAPGKSIYKAEWIAKPGPPVVLLKIEGARASQEAFFYVQLSCHPHIVHTYGTVQNDSDSLILVQEYATEGDLAELLREKEFQPSQLVLLEIFLQIIEAMIVLAGFGIVHGDLACRNVLVFRLDDSDPQENFVKLTDFGLTRASTLYSVIGSSASTILAVVPLRYAAPEIIRSAGISNYSEKSDVYSMGVLMWEAFSQAQPPYGSIEDDNEVRRRILNAEILTRPESCDEEMWDIVVGCWHQQPEARPTFKKLKQSLVELKSRLEAGPTLKFENLSIEPKYQSIRSSIDVRHSDVYSKVLNVVQNTVENRRQSQEQTLSSNEGSFIPRIDVSVGHLSFNSDLSTTMLVECEFCTQHLPGLGKLIHDQTITQLELDRKSIKDDGAKHLADTLKDNKTLKTLNLLGNAIGQKGALYLTKALRNNQVITTVDLSDNKIGDAGAQSFAEAIQNDQAPSELNLLVNKFAPQDAHLFAARFQNNQTLTTLNLSSNGITYQGATHLANALRKNQTLTTLNLAYNQIGHEGAQKLVDALRTNQTLTTLDIGGNKIGSAVTKSISEALRLNSTLTTLNMHDNQIDHEGAQHIAETLQHNKTLKTLNFSHNQIGFVGPQYLALALQNNKTLTTLQLSRTQISDVGAQYFAETIRNNQTLTTIDLSVNQIGDTGAQYLADALRHNQILTTFHLYENQISDIGARSIVEALRLHQTLITMDLRRNQISDECSTSLNDSLKNSETSINVHIRWNDKSHE